MKFAQWMSVIGHPFVTTVVLVSAAAMRLNRPDEALPAVLVVSLVALVPVAALIVVQVRRGAWQDADASRVSERPILFAVSIASLAALLVYLAVVRRDSFLLRGAAGALAMLAVCALVTRWVKVSLHLAFAALAGTSLLLLGSPVAWLFIVFIPVLAWSRLRLARHRPSELALGLVVGVATGLAIYLV